MPNKQPTFYERVSQMYDAANQLNDIAELINREAMRMAAAEKRFTERRGPKTERRAR